MKSFNDEILNIAHRGASGHAPENTMAAFTRAYELGADGVEFDVQLTKDGCPIIFHDDTFNRTTNGKGKVEDFTLDDTRQLDAGNWFSQEFKGEKVPQLDELLSYAQGQLLLNIEIKTTPYPKELAEKVVQAVLKYDILDQCLITSFDMTAVNWALELLPQCRSGFIIKKETPQMWEGGWDFIAAKGTLVNSAFMERVEHYNKRLVVWTVNEEKDMKELVKMGVGRIITNYPDRYNFVLKNQKKS